MKNKLLLLLSFTFIISCSKDDSENYINPDDYFTIGPGEEKVESFQLKVFSGSELTYSLYKVEVSDDINSNHRESRSDLINTKSLSPTNDTLLRFDGGLKFLHIENLNLNKDATFSIILNNKLDLLPTGKFTLNEQNPEWEFLIPYKY